MRKRECYFGLDVFFTRLLCSWLLLLFMESWVWAVKVADIISYMGQSGAVTAVLGDGETSVIELELETGHLVRVFPKDPDLYTLEGDPINKSAASSAQAVQRKIVLTPGKSVDQLSVSTFFEGDGDRLAGPDVKVKDLYLSKIKIDRQSKKNEFVVSYSGPLYAQCGSSEGHCASQSYRVRLDQCGRVLGFDYEGTKLQNYNPHVPGNHSDIDRNELQQLLRYVNNSIYLKSVYFDIAGNDQESSYILGNSIPIGEGIILRSFGESSYSTKRWGLNPWGTNTLATFLIHLDLIREAIK